MEDYKKKYEHALDNFKRIKDVNKDNKELVAFIEYEYPELKESKDEKMRNFISHELACLRATDEKGSDRYEELTNAITWLEKQGEQKSTDKVKSKFKVGDWIQYRHAKPFFVEDVTEQGYVNGDSCLPFEWEAEMHIWTIQDAKDGDVLYHKSPSGIEYIVMSSGVNRFGNVDSYFRYNSVDGFGISVPSVFNTKEDITPATEEHRDLLFQKMKEAGYEWDGEKKELKKIEQEEDAELTDFESALFSAFSDAWQEYLSGKEVNVAKWTREHLTELLEVARKSKFCHHEVDFSDCSEEYRKAYYDGWNNCNQQHAQLEAEQKPAWGEEDEKMFSGLNSIVEDWYNTMSEKEKEYYGDCGYIKWLKSLKERMKGE